jgi:glycosyltransferase involved in cell wall biosynthesis
MAEPAPAVSIIIPCYHVESYLGRAVASLLAQTMPDWEAAIVSDDGKDYEAILEAQGIHDPRLKFLTTGGIGTHAANARNIGLDATSAPLVAYLDADDAFMPIYLARMLPLAQAHAMAVSRTVYIDDATGKPLALPAIRNRAKGLVGIDDFPSLILRPGFISIVYNRVRVPARWHIGTVIAEDLLFLLQAYQYIPHIYTDSLALYRYYRRLGSTTRSDDEIAHFIAHKEELILAIERGDIFKHKPEIGKMAAKIFHFSLAAERDYVQTLKTDPTAEFTSFLAGQFTQAGLL